jgi:hypothetical protein
VRPYLEIDGGETVQGVHGVQLSDGPAVVLVGGPRPDRVWVVSAADRRAVRRFDTGEWFHRGGFIASHVYAAGGRAVLVTALDDQEVRQFDLLDGAPAVPPCPTRSASHAVTSYRDDASGDTVLAVGGEDGTVRRYDAATGAEAAPPLLHDAAVTAVHAYRVGGRLFLAAGDRRGRVWRWPIGGRSVGGPLFAADPVVRHRGMVKGFAEFGYAGRACLASWAADFAVIGWHADTLRSVGLPFVGRDVPMGVQPVATPAGTVLCVAHDRRVDWIDPDSAAPLRPPFKAPDLVDGIAAVTVDGRRLLFVRDDSALWRLDATTGEPVP